MSRVSYQENGGGMNNNYRWELRGVDFSPNFEMQLTRIKKGQEVQYRTNELIVKCVCYNYTLISLSISNPKVIKFGKGDLSHSFNMVGYLYSGSQGPLIGIILPIKAYIPTKKYPQISSMQIMAKYDNCLSFWDPSTPYEALDAMVQIAKGLCYLKNKGVYHGAVGISNVLFRSKHGKTRYDLASFRDSMRISDYKTRKSIVNALDHTDIHFEEKEKIKALKSKEVIREKFKELLFHTDAKKFCYAIQDISAKCSTMSCLTNCTKADRKLIKALYNLSGKLISELETDVPNIETLLEKLEIVQTIFRKI